MLKFSSNSLTEHAEVPLADEGRLEQLVDHWNARKPRTPSGDAEASACYVVSVGAGRDPEARAAQLAEIVALVENQGGQIVGQECCQLSVPNPRTLLGKGTAQALADRARAVGATLLVLDAELSPSQTRNLEDATGIAICDREAIILNVFVRHARSRRAKIQVEIAQLEYLRPRIRGVGLDMDQQMGGSKHARGPGETASELMARKLDGRLEELRKGLKKLEMGSKVQRAGRTECKRVVLVGYTNAGKTSLMNALTASELSARDMPFETLDTTSRCLTRYGGEVLLSDTVGFIRRLPARLLESFESTLCEINEASLLVIVVDIADYEREQKLQTTVEILEKLGAQELPRFYVFNQLDRLPTAPDTEQLERWSGGHPWAALSSRDREAVSALEAALVRAARAESEPLAIDVPYSASELLGLIYGQCRVLSSEATADGLSMKIQGRASVLARIQGRLGKVH